MLFVLFNRGLIQLVRVFTVLTLRRGLWIGSTQELDIIEGALSQRQILC